MVTRLRASNPTLLFKFPLVRLLPLLFLCSTWSLADAAESPLASPAPELDAQFQTTSGWIGADGAYSIPLGPNRILWLFGNSLVGRIEQGKRTSLQMINNSIALQSGTNRPSFYYGRAEDDTPDAFISPKNNKGYYWLYHGIRTTNGLYFFMNHMVPGKAGLQSSFKIADAWLAEVSNPEASPHHWKIKQERFPFTDVTPNGSLIFGGAVMRRNGFIYIYGTDTRADSRPGATQADTVLARVPEGEFANFKKWTFYGNGAWQSKVSKLGSVGPAFGSEFSVSWVPGRSQYVAIYTVGVTGNIRLRHAPSPEGPWSEPQHIFLAPEMKTQEHVFSYGGKAHPELTSNPNELIITYAASSLTPFELAEDPRLYWPRFVRVDLGSLHSN